MAKLSDFVAKIEARAGSSISRLRSRHRGRLKAYLPLGAVAWYFYGMLVNSIRLGIASTFDGSGETAGGIWVANPILNLIAVFTPTGLAVTGVGALLFCLITKKGYVFFSGYKYERDPRGFDILPDATHGSSGFMAMKDMHRALKMESIGEAEGTVIGKAKENPNDGDQFAKYLSIRRDIGLSDHVIVFGATGSGKSRGFVMPFIYQAAKRRESIIIVDPKGELYERTSGHLRAAGYTTRIFNLLDPMHSDGWNPLADIEKNPGLVDSIAEVIIKNTSNVSARQDFWENAEKNLLQALMHYVAGLTVPGTGRLLPIEQRSLGAVYRLLSGDSFAQLHTSIDALPRGHPAKAPYGIFKLANRQIWGNIAIGLGNRLSVYQNEQLDKLTSYNDIDLTLPGREPCAYYCVISAQDSQYEFLSSLLFSCLFTRLTDHARREGPMGRLPVCVNFVLEEFCNIGKLVDFKKQLAILRGFNVNCQVVVQSVPGLADRYEKKEWEEIISHCDTTICLGVNDLMTAQYISDKCGAVTIRVDNNQMPLMPLFSPIYHSTRPYSQTRSSTKRALMMPDEVMRLDNKKSIVLLRGHKPLLLDKITPEEFPVHRLLSHTKITDYAPHWRDAGTPGAAGWMGAGHVESAEAAGNQAPAPATHAPTTHAPASPAQAAPAQGGDMPQAAGMGGGPPATPAQGGGADFAGSGAPGGGTSGRPDWHPGFEYSDFGPQGSPGQAAGGGPGPCAPYGNFDAIELDEVRESGITISKEGTLYD